MSNLAIARSGRRRDHDDVAAGLQAVQPECASIVSLKQARDRRGHEPPFAARELISQQRDSRAWHRLSEFVEHDAANHRAARQAHGDVVHRLSGCEDNRRARPARALGAVRHRQVRRLRDGQRVASGRQTRQREMAGIVGHRGPRVARVVAGQDDARAAHGLIQSVVGEDRARNASSRARRRGRRGHAP